MKAYKAVIFDLDGVICSTDKYHYRAWKELADSIGVYFDESINNRLRGISRMASLEIILERSERNYSEEEKLGLIEKKNTRYRELLMKMSPADLPEDVRMTLNELKKRGVLLAIGSSSRNTKMILERLDCIDMFDAISDGTNISHSKPDPEVFTKAAQMLGVDPSVCLVVEDARSGIEAACRGGFDSAGIGEAADYERVTYPLRSSVADLIKNIANNIISGF